MDVDRLAYALCLSSHHATARSSWPCDYHRKRARDALRIMGRIATPAPSEREDGEE